VVRELQEIETASFRKDSPEVRSGEFRMEDIGTEVFLMPAATRIEKEGCFTNTERLVQWRDKALDPPVDCRSDLWFMHHLFKRVRAHYADSTASRDWPIQNLTWDYPEHGEHAEPSADAVLRKINGYEVAAGELVPGFAQLANDGSTACGCWIYSGIYADGVNQARRREPGDLSREGGWVAPEWGRAWPANRRVLYSRASADPQGRPWSEHRKYVWWDEEQRKWTGYDVPDFPVDMPPDYVAPPDAKDMDAISGSDPFIMQADGRGLAVRSLRLLDGPMPTHYEPLESPVHNRLYPGIDESPAALRWDRADNPVAETAWPLVATTFRLTEHHTAGGMSRWLPWLAELQPEMFAEIDPELARDRGIADGDWITISSPRAEIEARARVTDRIKPLRLGDRVTHQVGLPWHWGFGGPSPGDAANASTSCRAIRTSSSRSPRRSCATCGRGARRRAPARSPASTTRRPA
jgi:formate dehydrogenase major subunit